MFGAVDWRGIPGFRVGAAVITGKTGQGQSDFAARNARYTLWDVHTKWTPGAWDLSALYARGTIFGAGKLNATFGPGTTFVPTVLMVSMHKELINSIWVATTRYRLLYATTSSTPVEISTVWTSGATELRASHGGCELQYFAIGRLQGRLPTASGGQG